MKLPFYLLLSWSLFDICKLSECDFDKKCNKGIQEMINIHLIAHTHDDAGWLKNIEEYYIGSKKQIDRASVQLIINSVMRSLEKNPNRKFSYVEASYIYLWLNDPHRNTAEVQRLDSLIKNGSFVRIKLSSALGQLEIVSGGWVMNDEACTHYNDIINQMTLGFELMEDTFGSCARPTTGWQIDPFGHSAAQAALFAQMGFDGLFFGRLSDSIKYERNYNLTGEFVWTPEPSHSLLYGRGLGLEEKPEEFKEKNDILVSTLPNLYQPPEGFCFDLFCSDDPIDDDPGSSTNNVDYKADSFLSLVEVQSRNYLTNHVIVTMGNDFHYQEAERWYKNLDKLMAHINQKRSRNDSAMRFNIFYSTPGCYLHALRTNAVKNPHNVARDQANPPPQEGQTISNQAPDWSIKPTWPIVRGGDFFPLKTNIHTWTGYFTSRPSLKFMIRESSGLLQVCKQIQVLANLPNDPQNDVRELERAVALTQHHDAITGTAKQAVTYDYMERLAKGYPGCWNTIEAGLKKLNVMLNAEGAHFCPLLNISLCDITQTYPEVDLILYNPLPWSLSHYVTLPVPRGDVSVTTADGQEVPLQYLRLNINPVTNLLSSLVNKGSGLELNLTQSYLYYGTQDGFSSGAYVFRTGSMPPTELFTLEDRGKLEIIKGDVFQQVRQRGVFGSWVDQEVTLYSGQPWVEVTWTIGPIPSTGGPRDVITRYRTDLKTADTFYVDSNSRFMVERKLDPSNRFQEYVPENYYPATSKAFVRDQIDQVEGTDLATRQLAVVIDRPQGVASLANGSLEFMLHRRLVHDDGLGVGEPLNETGADGNGLVVRGRHWLIFDTRDKCNELMTSLAQKVYLRPQIAFINPLIQIKDSNTDTTISRESLMSQELPPNVHLLSLATKNDSLLVRLEHIYSPGEHATLSKPAMINLEELFKTFDILTVEELALGGDRLLKETPHYDWLTTKWDKIRSAIRVKADESHQIKLEPLDIRTFRLGVRMKI